MRAVISTTLAAAVVLLATSTHLSGAEAPRIVNDSSPRHGTTTIELEPLWTLGGAEDDVLLGTIERVLVLDDGRTLLLDSQMSRVLECSPDGEVIRMLGHPGEGPGELTNPRDLVCFSDGTLGLVKMFPGRLVMLSPTGDPAGVISMETHDAPGGFATLHRSLEAGGTLLLGGSVMTMDPDKPVQTRTFFLGRFDLLGNKLTEYVRTTASFDLREGKLHESWQEFVWSRMDVADDGTLVVCIPRDEFEISWFDSEGALLRTATLPAEPWARNRRAHDRMLGILKRQADHMPGTEPVPASTEPVVVDLMVRANGDVWCLTSRSMWEPEADAFASYDVIDENGRYTRRMRVVCAGDPTSDRLLFSGDRAYRIAGYWDAVDRVAGTTTEKDTEPMSVTCYRIRSR